MNRFVCAFFAAAAVLNPSVFAEETKTPELEWPQFRGPQGLGHAVGEAKFPVQFGPERNALWKTPLPAGNSSPCICGDRIVLTGADPAKQLLETLCLDRRTGQVLWRRSPKPVAKLETSLHPTNGPATPTPVTDGQQIYVYFGSYGLLAYDLNGNEKWAKPLPFPGTTFGSGSSPILAGTDLLLLTCQGKGSCLLAVNRHTGETAWKTERPRFGAGYATPILRANGPTTEVILSQSRGVVAYNLKNGAELWWLGGLFGGIPSPALTDGLLFVVSHFPGGNADERMIFPKFDDLLKKYDADKNGILTQKEVPAELVLHDRGSADPKDNITIEDMFSFIDKNHDGQITRQEWEDAIVAFAKIESALVAVRLGGKGDLTKEPFVWKEKAALPEVPSPLAYQGRLYLVKNGGIASCFDPQTGKLLYRERLGASGFYYASPVAADGMVYAASFNGVLVVFKAGDQCRVLARNKLGQAIIATPALADGKVYVRTEGFLYAFGSG
jgi:outer membrane protein assembly factor BamB